MLLQKYGGISRYYFEIYKYIKKNKTEWNAITDCFFSMNSYFEPVLKNRPLRKHFRGARRIDDYLKINQKHAKSIIDNNNIDIIQPTFFDPYILEYVNNQKLVVTVYDMIHELFPEYYDNPENVISGKKRLLYAADKIIAISENTKKDILNIYPDIPSDKIEVIYIGNSFKLRHNIEQGGLPDKYILFVGQRSRYKNFNVFFKGVEPLLMRDKNLYLLCVGGGTFDENENRLLSAVKDRVIQMDVNDAILQEAYTNAQCFVFPSLYEGFGIPTLEAFSCDCPVVLSNTSSMPEVGGNAVLYINPNDPSDIENKVSLILTNKDVRNDLICKGREQLKHFDWNILVPEILNCYAGCLRKMN